MKTSLGLQQLRVTALSRKLQANLSTRMNKRLSWSEQMQLQAKWATCCSDLAGFWNRDHYKVRNRIILKLYALWSQKYKLSSLTQEYDTVISICVV